MSLYIVVLSLCSTSCHSLYSVIAVASLSQQEVAAGLNTENKPICVSAKVTFLRPNVEFVTVSVTQHRHTKWVCGDVCVKVLSHQVKLNERQLDLVQVVEEEEPQTSLISTYNAVLPSLPRRLNNHLTSCDVLMGIHTWSGDSLTTLNDRRLTPRSTSRLSGINDTL